MSVGTSPTRKNDRTAEVALRGLRFTENPQIPKELHRTVIPWLRVRLFTRDGITTAHCYQDDGEPMRVGKRFIAAQLAISDGPTAKRAWARALRSALKDDNLVLNVVDSQFRERRVVRAVAPILVASVLILTLYTWVGPSGRTWSGFLAWLAANWGSASLGLIVLGAPLMLLCVFLWSSGRVNVTRMRLARDGITAEVYRGGTVFAQWDQVRSIQRRSFGFEVRLNRERSLRVAPGRGSFFLEDQMIRIHGLREARGARPLIITVLALFQIGGLVAAYLSASGLAQFPYGPIGTYLAVAFAYPTMMVFAAGVPWLFIRLARRHERRRRAIKRQVRRGRLVS